jgi:hypothetical protein
MLVIAFSSCDFEETLCQMKKRNRPRRHPRESSDNPRLNAFCRVAPSMRLRVLAIFLAGVLLRAADFSSRTSALVQARLFEFLLAMYDSPNLKVRWRSRSYF